MYKSRKLVGLLLSLLFFYGMLYFTFKEADIFWYLYTFTLLIGISIAIIYGKFKDELPTWRYLLYGIGYGTIIYGIIRIGYIVLSQVYSGMNASMSNFLNTYGPSTIWHYLLLICIIAVGEELFWRGFVQQHLKEWVSPIFAVVITSILFASSVALSGFLPGAMAALAAGLILGFLYEWKKSMPLIIVSHEIFILLLFMILPL
ncbi:CPBP family intramembrane metalloprotease [Lysinibacillus yapensis]|uniref:CPBP family intramembrane metalloprotease n=1 Tax=Ureibacillus yapensis TaxID=2304605 RepID=A0A396SE04_9BACL|nr:CPBP family intramembrane glutamic endopeptidase [Lysinibacillus yapensis]RHW39826.1 CPBP family intramembrane metalloprotease [Lysinibacillus yapensis]